MNNFITTLHEIEVASTENAITVTDKFENINGREFIAKLNVAHDGDKTGSHWIRTALCLDPTKKCKPRNNENAESLARLVVIDGDRSINANGEEIEGAPDPLQVSEILRVNDIGHILYGSYSHYTGGKGNRYRILLITKASYNKEQLTPTAERVVSLINNGLAKLGGELLAYAKENGTWAQPWYYPRKPENSLISALYLEYLEGNTIDIMEPMVLPAEGHKNYQVKADEISPIHAFNEQKNLADALLHYGYKRVLSTKEYEKWLSPDSSSGVAGITVKGNKFFSHHNDEFNNGHWHDVFDFMRVKRGITEHEAVIVAARNTRVPDGRSVDEYNKSLVKNKSMAAILSVPLTIPFETYQPFDDELLPVDAIPYGALPEQMANFIKEQSEIRGCPPDFILISILSRMGVLFAGKLAIALTRRTTWHAIPNFFWLMIGSPSSGKSNALSATEKPIKMLADIARAAFKQQNKAYKAEMNMLTRQLNSALKGLDRENEKLAPDQDKVIGFRKRIQEIQQEIYDLEDNKPTLKVYTVNKTTFEKLILTLKENQAGILLELDEVAPIFIRLSKDENCEERGLYLTGYNGNASYSYRTVSRDEDLIDRVVLSIIGGTQPSKIQRVVNEAKNDTSNDGFLQRFQGVVYPDKKVYLPQDKHGENLLEIELNNVIQNLDHLPLSDQIIFRFDDEAQIIFDEWREESTKQAYGLEPHLSAHVGKAYEFVAALSVYLYLYDNNGCVSSKPLITAEYILRAIKLGAYFFSHAKRMYGLAYNNDIPARSLASKLTQLGSFFSRSQIRDKGWSNLIKKEERLEAITALIKRGYISEAIEGKFYINPKYLIDE